MVPESYQTDDGFALGKWIAYQRSRYRGTKRGRSIAPEQNSELEALGMVWTVRSRQ